MEREYFCGGCGLFYWSEMKTMVSENGMISYISHNGCPNKDCISHEERNVAVFAVDTMAYAYFTESHSKFIQEINWSSPKYAPSHAIEIYRHQGIRIEE